MKHVVAEAATGGNDERDRTRQVRFLLTVS